MSIKALNVRLPSKIVREAKLYCANNDLTIQAFVLSAMKQKLRIDDSPDDSKQYVYFMQDVETKDVKIGISKHPEERLKQVEYAEGRDLKLLHVCDTNGRCAETELHEKFEAYRLGESEWFLPDNEIFEYIYSTPNQVT